MALKSRVICALILAASLLAGLAVLLHRLEGKLPEDLWQRPVPGMTLVAFGLGLALAPVFGTRRGLPGLVAVLLALAGPLVLGLAVHLLGEALFRPVRSGAGRAGQILGDLAEIPAGAEMIYGAAYAEAPLALFITAAGIGLCLSLAPRLRLREEAQSRK